MSIKVINNVPNLNVTVGQAEDGSFTIVLAEDKKKALGTAELGSIKKIGNREFIVLEHTEQGTAVIAKDFAKRMEYGSTGDYETSDVRSYCIGDFYNEMVEAVGAENIIRHTVDLTADDGTGIKTVEDFVSVLTTERYRRYRKFLKAKDEVWWTTTRATAEVSDYSDDVCCVNHDGVLDCYACGWGRSVRPFLILDSSILVE